MLRDLLGQLGVASAPEDHHPLPGHDLPDRCVSHASVLPSAPRSCSLVLVRPRCPWRPLRVVAGHDPLFAALHGEGPGGNVLRDGGPSPGPRPVADPHRRHQHGIRADVHVVADGSPMLLEAVVVHRHGPRADVRPGADVCIAYVRQVRDLASRAHA